MLLHILYNSNISSIYNSILSPKGAFSWDGYFINVLRIATSEYGCHDVLRYSRTLDYQLGKHSALSYLAHETWLYLPAIFIVLLFGSMLMRGQTRMSAASAINSLASNIWLFGALCSLSTLIVIWFNPSNGRDSGWLASHGALGGYFLFIFLLLTILVLLYKRLGSLLVRGAGANEEVSILITILVCFSVSMFRPGNLALFVICLEGFSLTLYVMASLNRMHGGITGAVKYFSFGTLGSIFIYWGTLYMFEIIGRLDLPAVFDMFEVVFSDYGLCCDADYTARLAHSGSLIIIGLLVKLGAAPLHQWVPDVYAGVPFFITSVYATFVKVVLFVVFVKFAVSFAAVQEIEYISIASLIIGCLGTLRQVEIKRFLAYSSITHVGYLLSGDLLASYVYLITYVLASITLFMVLLNLRLNGRELIYLQDLRFVGQSVNKLDRPAVVISLSSMAGLPPFAGFYGKLLIWSSLIEDIYLYEDMGSHVLLFINIVVSLIVIFYYMQVVCIVFVNNEHALDNVVTTIAVSDTRSNSDDAVCHVFTAKYATDESVQYALIISITFFTLILPTVISAVHWALI